ncbi:energy-coupling factor ABC transporter ATP-binding protein [Herbaspirillum rhizosphaerae]|uniref:energy-coupling factor ABC transporter ATP-binding protein n=1 Tax=Herbaspirillum rhizosphaerae TaxID=346179 RepID=UPI00067D9C53|nr:ABC transporter ATP-binding protein [Herbaspirillum rhizosphaerae]
MNLKTIHSRDPTASGIVLRDVTLKRSDRFVFEKLSVNLSESRIGLIGDNGAGKSSLFRLICGLDQPQAGRVTVHGCDTANAADRRALPCQVGLMFQNPDDQIIFPTVAEELAFSLTAAGADKKQAREQALAFLIERDRADWAPRAIGELSQGQRQQVCLMALQITHPATLLLDEPYSSLDMPSQLRLSAQIRATDQQIILSTHLLEHVQDFERVLWLADGVLRGDGPGREVCAAYAQDVRERCGGDAAVNHDAPLKQACAADA